MILLARYLCCASLVAILAGCGPSYSPNTYASNAVQQANKADQGIVVGVREVDVSASGAVGTVTGAAAGGIAGSQAVPAPLSAFTALGGSLIGGIAGNAAEHGISDTKAYEYIVRKPNGDLVSVTQKDTVPLALGQKVLVIAGTQARVVPDYTVPIETAAKSKSNAADAVREKSPETSGDRAADATKDKAAEAIGDKPADATTSNATSDKLAGVDAAKAANKSDDAVAAAPATPVVKPSPATDSVPTSQPKVETGP
jgi:outer membrane lipoprotein SlyB